MTLLDLLIKGANNIKARINKHKRLLDIIYYYVFMYIYYRFISAAKVRQEEEPINLWSRIYRNTPLSKRESRINLESSPKGILQNNYEIIDFKFNFVNYL